MIRELIARCPDRETENVIADWCEEQGRLEIAGWLRGASPEVRAAAVKHLTNTLETPLSAEAFRSALELFRVLPGLEGRIWVARAEQLMQPNVKPYPQRFFVRSFDREEDGELTRVVWCFAGELFERAASVPFERVVPLGQVATAPCGECKRAAPVMGQQEYQVDGAGDNAFWASAYTLCLYEPHVAKVGGTRVYWDTAID